MITTSDIPEPALRLAERPEPAHDAHRRGTGSASAFGAIEAGVPIQVGLGRLMSSIEMGLVEQTLAANHLATASEGCST